MTDKYMQEKMQIIDKMNADALKLCEDLLNPEKFGFAVNKEIRNRAREVFGIEGRE